MEAQPLELDLPILGTGNNPRSEGLHLTTVIRDLMQAVGLGPAGKGTEWDRESTMAAGFVWEEVLQLYWEDLFSPALASLLGSALNWYPTGELYLDDIYLTPDGVDVQDRLTVQEAKFTWKSVNSDPLDNWYYMTQLKSYCKAIGSTRAVLHVYHAMGDYRGSGPIYKPWLITFLPHELEENWKMILNHAEHMRSRTGES